MSDEKPQHGQSTFNQNAGNSTGGAFQQGHGNIQEVTNTINMGDSVVSVQEAMQPMVEDLQDKTWGTPEPHSLDTADAIPNPEVIEEFNSPHKVMVSVSDMLQEQQTTETPLVEGSPEYQEAAETMTTRLKAALPFVGKVALAGASALFDSMVVKHPLVAMAQGMLKAIG